MSEKGSDEFLKGNLLVAMPALGDPRFYKSVIFVCAHDENGAMGIVVNHLLPNVNFIDIIQKIQLPHGRNHVLEKLDIPVLGGGPVETARGFLLHSADFQQPDTVKVNDDFCVTGTVNALKAIAEGNGPEKVLFALGCAGWSAGQLDSEMQQNSWITVRADQEIVFETPIHDKWEESMKKIGIHPSMLSSVSGTA